MTPILRAKIRRHLRQRDQPSAAAACKDYTRDPVAYVHEVLKVEHLWEKIADVLVLLTLPPYRVLVRSGHNVGKTFAAGCAVNWFYDSFDPSVVITTAPTERDVVDLLWTEVRLQRRRAGLSEDFIGLRAPEMRTSDEHWAKGYTARKGESFQGRHRNRMLFVFDEAEGVDPAYWETTNTMFQPQEGHAWLCIGNPTTTTSRAYLEEMAIDKDGAPKWHVVTLSALDHPNIAAQLAGLPVPVPAAVSVEQIDAWLSDWAEEIPLDEVQATDVRWRDKYFRCGPVAEPRILGRRPSAGTFGVWSDSLWQSAVNASLEPDPRILPRLGCDVARHGDDFTEIHARWGDCSLSHESHNGWTLDRTHARLVELAHQLAGQATRALETGRQPVSPKLIPLVIDDDGLGGGLTDFLKRDGYNVCQVGAGTTAARPDLYPNKRSELWFQTAGRARLGKLDLHRLSRKTLHELRRQAMTPEWANDNAGRRVVEKKDVTKEKLGRSPDSMDALNLAWYEGIQILHEDKKREEEAPVYRFRFGGKS